MLFLPILVSLKTNMDSFQSLIFFNIFINDILTRESKYLNHRINKNPWMKSKK